MSAPDTAVRAPRRVDVRGPRSGAWITTVAPAVALLLGNRWLVPARTA